MRSRSRILAVSGPPTCVSRARRAPRSVLVGLACLLVLLVVPAAGALADELPEDSWAYDLAGEVMSPFCPGRTIASCPSPQAAELIQWIILQEKAGATREEVEEQLYARYGDVIRSAPKPEGWGLAAYVIPLLSAVFGIAVVVWVLRRLSSGGPGATRPGLAQTSPAGHAAPSTPSDEEIERLVDRELDQI